MKSTVIIPAFNNAALTKQCVEAVLHIGGCKIIVVDDASTDDTSKMLANFGIKIQTIAHRANQGFAKTCNDGAHAASTEFVVFLNNDTIPQPGWLRALERYAQINPQTAVVGSKLLYPNGTVQHAGSVICQDKYPRHIYTGFSADHPAVSRSRRFQLVTAASMLVRRKVFIAARGFDTKFTNGFEDVDFCLRLGELSHEVHYCAESVVQHFESVSPGRFKRDKYNVALYRKRWLNKVQSDEFQFYAADGLLAAQHEGRYPFELEVAPELAILSTRRGAKAERTLRTQTRQIAGLQRENTRLRLALHQHAGDSPELRYQKLRGQIITAAKKVTPTGAKILVISKGDESLLAIAGRHAQHFPQTARGVYAGHHPADSADAIAALKFLHTRGATHLLIPATSLWWLKHYAVFRRHLDKHHTRLEANAKTCFIYELKRKIAAK